MSDTNTKSTMVERQKLLVLTYCGEGSCMRSPNCHMEHGYVEFRDEYSGRILRWFGDGPWKAFKKAGRKTLHVVANITSENTVRNVKVL